MKDLLIFALFLAICSSLTIATDSEPAYRGGEYVLILDKSGEVTNPLSEYPESLKLRIQDEDGTQYEVMNRTYCNSTGQCTTTKTDDFCGLSFVGRRGMRHLTLSGCKSTSNQ